MIKRVTILPTINPPASPLSLHPIPPSHLSPPLPLSIPFVHQQQNPSTLLRNALALALSLSRHIRNTATIHSRAGAVIAAEGVAAEIEEGTTGVAGAAEAVGAAVQPVLGAALLGGSAGFEVGGGVGSVVAWGREGRGGEEGRGEVEG